MNFLKYKVWPPLITAVLAVTQLMASPVLSGEKKERTGPYLSFQVSRADLPEVFQQIEQQTDFKFAFNEDIINSNQRFDLSYQVQPLEKILEDISIKAQVEFKIINTMISVTKKSQVKESGLNNFNHTPGNGFPTGLKAEVDWTITGKVTDEKNMPLPGVHVTVKGNIKEGQGTVTDGNGSYSITVPDKNVTLLFSFIGCVSQAVALNNQTVVNVKLLPDVKSLKEVVITGFGDVKQLTYTGAAQSLKMDNIQVQGMADVSQMLQGRVAGLNIQTVSGTFGAGPKITIRGGASILGDATPLWVIDGVVQEDIKRLSVNDLVSGNSGTLIGSAIAGLNPNDIESFEILKDAAATSIYGSRSLNGVIVIKTKRGKRDTPLNISAYSEYTIRDLPDYSRCDILDSKENFGILKQLEDMGELDMTTLSQSRYSGVYGILSNRVNTFNPATNQFAVQNLPADRNRFLQEYERANTDWFTTLFRSSATQNHTFNFSGGGNNSQFYSSIGLYKDPGWTIADKVDRLTASLRNTFILKNKAQLTISLLGSYRQQRAPGSFDRSTDPVAGTVSRDFDINPYSYALNTSRTLRPYDSRGNLEYYTYNWAPFNILHETKNNFINLRVQDIKLQADFQTPLFTDKLQYAFVGAVRYAGTGNEHRITNHSNVAEAYRAEGNTIIRNANTFLWTNPDDPTRIPVTVMPKGGILSRKNNFMRSFYIRNSLRYNQLFNQLHELDVFIGQELRLLNQEENHSEGYGLDYDYGYLPRTDPRIMLKILGQGGSYFGLGSTRERAASFFSSITYAFKERYVFSFTGNLNTSNMHGLKNNKARWTPTYTLGAKWNLKKENFLQNNNLFTTLSLRTTYGLTGITGPSSNTLPIFRNMLTGGRRNISDHEMSIYIEELQNNDLTYEKQFELNIGADVGLLGNRVNLTADIYQRNGFDLFDYVQTPAIGGQSRKLINNANMVTRGIELQFQTANIKSKSLEWTSTINFSVFRQRVTQVENKPNLLDACDETGAGFAGFPRNSIFSIPFAGLTDQGLPAYKIPGEDKRFDVDFQDNGEMREGKAVYSGGLMSYLKYEGPSDANKTISLQNTITCKNWSLGCFIIASAGNKIRLPALFNRISFTDLNAYPKYFLDRWMIPGDEKVTPIPVIPSFGLMEYYGGSAIRRAYNAYNYSTERVADGGYIRMRTVFLKYTFPAEFLRRLFMKNLSLTAQIQNPWLIWSDSRLHGVEPEFYNTGGVAQPIIRQYTLTLNVGF